LARRKSQPTADDRARKTHAAARPGPPSGTRRWLAALGALVLLLALGSLLYLATESRPGPSAAAEFAGTAACAGCHQAQAALWRPSQHALAMQHATDRTVLANFNDAGFEYAGVQSRFFRKHGKFMVETDGSDGELAVFEVKYTFGLEPLQQYLIEFPDGRVQALSIAWDSRPVTSGGQRWFHLYRDEAIRHDDVLHWTKLNQNWNFMCAECHSTGVRRNYDAAADRFATRFAEIGVGCEACHGQGSRHVAWAREQQSWWPFGKRDLPAMGLLTRFAERRDVRWSPNAATGTAIRGSAPQALRTEVETCGLCHARRSQFSEAWVPGQPLSQTHQVSLLARGLYQPDGQMLDEVYNYGSFQQSRMFAAGVTCSDCHEPHAAKLRAPGDGVCLQCHTPDKFAAASHHRHEGVDPQPTCASCHMPVRSFMVVDPRHDHSFRVPRPDLSTKLGTRNACNDCHASQSADWAAEAIERWHGPIRKGFQTYGEAFHAAWTGGANATTLLDAIASDRRLPAFARASALAELGSRLSPSHLELARAGLADADPLVRIGALEMIEEAPVQSLWPLAAALLSDPNRGVRIHAASLLASVPEASRPRQDRARFEHAASEFIAAQRLNDDRPEARTALGSFFARSGRHGDAEAEYLAALRLSPQFTPASVNLSDLLRELGRDEQGETVLRTAIALSPGDAGLHHALGLALIRLTRPELAQEALRRATELEPSVERYTYVHAVALHSSGQPGAALDLLERELTRHPESRDILGALVGFSRERGNIAAAREYAVRLQQIAPSPELAELIGELTTRN
jgi:predicted CXXCH cytochrome family protein